MSLNWNLEEIKDYNELFVGGEGEKRLDALTESFIWASMATGLGKGWSLDEDFAPEFFARIKMIEKVNGPLVFKAGEKKDYSVTPEDVQRRIGLHVNVSPVSRAQFVKNLITHELDACKRHYTRQLAKQSEVAAG